MLSVDCLLAGSRWNSVPSWPISVVAYYSIPPDDVLQLCPKHVQVDWWNKLRINSASSLFLLHKWYSSELNCSPPSFWYMYTWVQPAGESLWIVWPCHGLKLASPDLISHIFISTDYITLHDRKTMNEMESWVSGYAWLSWGRLQRTQCSHIPGQDLTRIFQMWSRSSACWTTALGCMVLAVCHKQEGWAAIIPGLLCGLNVSSLPQARRVGCDHSWTALWSKC